MLIEKIVIKNFRVYNGINELLLATDTHKNVSIISGNNGYGKTSFLSSLVWCLYGKLMSDVDERYRREIYESGGYKRYCEKVMNRLALYSETVNVKENDSFSVSLQLSKLYIPSVPCENIQITRSYNIRTHSEIVEILIDGRVNELTKEVGSEIFINDFILPKEIAKFFFFDAEKIVSLAEIRTADEKRALSQAYAEVLGIKKYLDLKENLENLRFRLRKKSSETGDRNKLERLKKQVDQSEKLIAHTEDVIREKEEELSVKRLTSDKFQEQLIREGTSITLEELKDFKQMKEHLEEDGQRIKNELKDLLELAPFAIVANKLEAVKNQLEAEQANSNKVITEDFLLRKLTAIRSALKKNGNLSLNAEKENILIQVIRDTLIPNKVENFKPLLDYSPEQYNRFLAIYDNLQNAYSKSVRQVISNLKKQQSSFNVIVRKLHDAESKENDPLIKTIRNDKIRLDSEIRGIENELVNLKAQKLSLQNDVTNLLKQVSELAKKVNVEEIDREKDETAARLIGELEGFIKKLKNKKKSSLEGNILRELNRLMHKTNFVHRVEVVIDGDLIDIELFDATNAIINKDGLSKGEQQLYATALLKALVDESNIRFPVFIDSPLQKFDKEHAQNIITDFYPNVSGQVILFPLLEKELNEQEYQWLLPKVGSAYLINQIEQYSSSFYSVLPNDLFSTYRQHSEHVYNN